MAEKSEKDLDNEVSHEESTIKNPVNESSIESDSTSKEELVEEPSPGEEFIAPSENENAKTEIKAEVNEKEAEEEENLENSEPEINDNIVNNPTENPKKEKEVEEDIIDEYMTKRVENAKKFLKEFDFEENPEQSENLLAVFDKIESQTGSNVDKELTTEERTQNVMDILDSFDSPEQANVVFQALKDIEEISNSEKNVQNENSEKNVQNDNNMEEKEPESQEATENSVSDSKSQKIKEIQEEIKSLSEKIALLEEELKSLGVKQPEIKQPEVKQENATQKPEQDVEFPEFAMIGGDNRIHSYKGYKLKGLYPADKIGKPIYQLTNGERTLDVDEKTFKEISDPSRVEKAKGFDENTPTYKKLLETQYNDFFQQRDNTTVNFRHNLAVYCRKEANNPLEANKVAREIISRMDKEEQKKCKAYIKAAAKSQGKSIGEFIADEYHTAVKSLPLNAELVKKGAINNTKSLSFYPKDDIRSGNIEKSDALIGKNGKDYNLKVGDTIPNIKIKIRNANGEMDTLQLDNLKIISASKDSNKITVMRGESDMLDIPRDKVLEWHKQHAQKEMKKDMQQTRRNTVNVGFSR